jgi:ataxin-10
MCQQLCPMIASTFFDLGEYSISAIDRAAPSVSSPASAPPSLSSTSSSGTGSSTSSILTPPEMSFGHIHPAPPQTPEVPLTSGELDMLLPSVCEALVLMTQCLITFALTSEDEGFDFPLGDNPKDFLNAAMVEEGVGMPEIIISVFQWMHKARRGFNRFFAGLLQRFDRLLPRVMFGKPVDLSTLPLPSGVSHQTHPAPTMNASPKDSTTDDDSPVKAGFSYVKRDLVRLLGVLCEGERVTQDRVRACGGIPVVMNLCVVDERNPCKSLKRVLRSSILSAEDDLPLLYFGPFHLCLVILPRH